MLTHRLAPPVIRIVAASAAPATGRRGDLLELLVAPHLRIPASCTAKTPAARLGIAPRTWLPYGHEPTRSVAGES
jgi:hypothetical protein